MSWLQRRIEQFSDPQRGWNDLMTYWRQGLKELRSVIFSESPHARETDPAMWGNKLPMEIYEDRHGNDRGSLGQEHSSPTHNEMVSQFEQAMSPPVASRDAMERDDLDLDKE